ncbi:hypothetical protein SC738_01510 [Legionella pneumophila serogroup 1]|uniref:hypothetical protein n=1 Tax=Legionella pneumophila TaxID=446 RepID=UPI0007709BAE|nr:hypothetical protein [Legionella pneumophila]HAT8820404.1 hypothetical protein [Legionella pneumophila subsp. pneumophila]MCZ4747103.1 hypothetical protein [Legionella pneumophila]MDO5157304.1 hypothetical protein [Legionella pneumophila]MDO5161450.1 hypothetical protein [Legionella pneumophila]MDO5163534.1 hypothetical protein [Legionella pneumophila]
MTIFDDGDIIRGVGFVAVYSAYLEDQISDLVKLASPHLPTLRENIHQLSLGDQAKHLRKALSKLFNKSSLDYISKAQEQHQVEKTLKIVEKITAERNEAIHSVLISNNMGTVMQKNSRLNTEHEINSAYFYELANYIFELQSQVFGLQFPITRLIANKK